VLQASFAYNKYCCTEAKPVETRPNLEPSQTKFKRIPTNQNSPFYRLILTSVTKNVTQRRIKAVYGARQPNASKHHSNTWNGQC